MKNFKIKFLCVLAAVYMAFTLTLAACGGDGNGGNGGSGGSGGSGEATALTLEDFNLPQTLAEINIVTDDGQDITGDWRNQPYKGCAVTVTGGRDGENFSGVRASVRIRGNNTATFPKKSYRIKFDAKRSLLGLNGGAKCKNWVLLACYKDVSFLRDAVVFELGKNTLAENGYYCSDFSYANVSVNGSYNGLYLVAEQQQVNPNRVNINEPTTGYTGTDIGYLVEYDGNASVTETIDNNFFQVNYSSYPVLCEDGTSFTPTQFGVNGSYFKGIVYYTVKNDMYSNVQRDYAQSYIENAFRILYEAVQKDRYYKFNSTYSGIEPDYDVHDSKAAVEKVVDLTAYVDSFLIQEFACDNDVDWSSFFMTFDMSPNGNKKLVLQAPWDFDSGLGMMHGQEKVEKIFTANVSTNSQKGLNPWLAVLWKADWFKEMCADRWNELMASGVFDRLPQLIDVVTEGYEEEFAKNYAKWDNLGVYTDELFQSQTVLDFKTHADAAAYLKNWINERTVYLTEYFNSLT